MNALPRVGRFVRAGILCAGSPRAVLEQAVYGPAALKGRGPPGTGQQATPVPADCHGQQGQGRGQGQSHPPPPFNPADPPHPWPETAPTPGSRRHQCQLLQGVGLAGDFGNCPQRRGLVQLNRACVEKPKATLSARAGAAGGGAEHRGGRGLVGRGSSAHPSGRGEPGPSLVAAGCQEQPSVVSGPRARGQIPTLRHSGQH